jgi:hypothetical protein
VNRHNSSQQATPAAAMPTAIASTAGSVGRLRDSSTGVPTRLLARWRWNRAAASPRPAMASGRLPMAVGNTTSA